MSKLFETPSIPLVSVVFRYKYDAPSWDNLTALGECSDESVLPIPFYSKASDLQTNSSSKGLSLLSNKIKDLKDFSGKFQLDGLANWILIAENLEANGYRGVVIDRKNRTQLLTPLFLPPSVHEVLTWIQSKNCKPKINLPEEVEENNDLHHLTEVNLFSSHTCSKEICSPNSQDFIPATPEPTPTGRRQNFPTCSTIKTSTPHMPPGEYQSSKRLSKIFSKKNETLLNKRRRKLKFLALKQDNDDSNLSGGSEDLFHDSIDEDIIDLTISPTMNIVPKEKVGQKSKAENSFKLQQINTNFREIVYSPSPSRMSFSQNIAGVTPNNTYGFKYASQNLAEANKLNKHQYLTLICIECLTAARVQLQPDPTVDPVIGVFFIVTLDYPVEEGRPNKIEGAILTCGTTSPPSTILDIPTLWVENETELLDELTNVVKKWDPDIFLAYEVQMKSWGYLLDRAGSLGIDMSQRLSRLPGLKGSHFDSERDEFGFGYTHHIHITGRIILNLWRLLKSEVTLTSYSFENVVYHVLHQRIPEYTPENLFKWWNDDLKMWRTMRHYRRRCDLTIILCERLDFVRRTSELARLFGMQFYDVLSRGTQLRVESMMLRLTRLSNMVAVSPNAHQRAAMDAPEWLALNMEPESKFYTDPVLVLDFQSLYPSVMIAHNYCFSTCLGKVSSLAEDDLPFKFGTGLLSVDPESLMKMVDQLSISPCGVAFVPKSVREGILPKMLDEILTTRLMVKKAMKVHKDDPLLQRVLHARQLGLKLISNVTYGYTSANFSGRMPCVEVADSVVSKGREILERAILMVNSTPSWGGRVVYGDTDSMFVHLPGASKERAFVIGQEIARRVTEINPKPIKLKFEKVYLPCILQTKKRYAGYMYETPEQKDPVFDAKGIETIRRDGCPASSKLLEKSLRILFDTSDVSLVKSYVQKQLTKLMQGKISLEDLIFAKEFRGLRGYRPGACVPSLELTRQWCSLDHRRAPLIGERVPYVIIYGAPQLPLIKLVRSPRNLLTDASLRINDQYYANKALLPPLHRCFSLLSVDVFSWYATLPKAPFGDLILECISEARTESIARFFTLAACAVCGAQTKSRRNSGALSLCDSCSSQPRESVLHLMEQMTSLEQTVDTVGKICFSCMGLSVRQIDCVSLDCPITYRLSRAVLKTQLVPKLKQTINLFN